MKEKYIFYTYIFQGNPGRTLHEAQLGQIECAKLTVSCLRVYNCMEMSEKVRDDLILSGKARFSFLTAFHPCITSRQIHYLGPKLSISHPTSLFDIICKLEIILSHMSAFNHTSQMIHNRTQDLKTFCKSLSNIYQVFSDFLFL